MILSPRLIDRPRSAAVEAAAAGHGFTSLQSRVIAGRLRCQEASQVIQRIRPTLTDLSPPDALPDIEKAADAIASAVIKGDPIILNADFDVDGVSASATCYEALHSIFGVSRERIQVYYGVRKRDGYGLSPNVAERILATGAPGSTLITLDQGSSDSQRVTQLVDAGHRVIVTDHHLLEGRGPPAALAVVNPMRDDSAFPDPRICGVHVAWLTMCAVRQRLIERGHLPRTTPRLGGLLDFVGLGALADVTDLGRSSDNRVVINAALERMNHSVTRPCWAAYRQLARITGPFDSATLGFGIGPALNSRGRVSESSVALDFLLAKDAAVAYSTCAALLQSNAERKAIQAKMLERSTPAAMAFVKAGYRAITIYDPEGHSGIAGVAAARLVELTGRPVAYFCPRQGTPDRLTGSLRTVPGFHVRNALAAVARVLGEDGVPLFGGHEGAGGATVPVTAVDAFREQFQRVAEATLAPEQIGPRVLTDGELLEPPTLATVSEIAALSPFGRSFEPPVFRMKAVAHGLTLIGADKTHLRLTLRDPHGRAYEGIWFGAVRDGRCPVAEDQPLDVAFELDANTFRDQTRLQLRVRHATAA